jgi:hypothetical protein
MSFSSEKHFKTSLWPSSGVKKSHRVHVLTSFKDHCHIILQDSHPRRISCLPITYSKQILLKSAPLPTMNKPTCHLMKIEIARDDARSAGQSSWQQGAIEPSSSLVYSVHLLYKLST